MTKEELDNLFKGRTNNMAASNIITIHNHDSASIKAGAPLKTVIVKTGNHYSIFTYK